MGLTYVLGIFRGPETSVIADLEAAEHGETVPLRTYGPYRSEYGRLGEFPNLPPLLVRLYIAHLQASEIFEKWVTSPLDRLLFPFPRLCLLLKVVSILA